MSKSSEPPKAPKKKAPLVPKGHKRLRPGKDRATGKQLLCRKPHSKRRLYLDPKGEIVKLTSYWLRRLADRDVEEC